MKRLFLIIVCLCAASLFLTGCGDGSAQDELGDNAVDASLEETENADVPAIDVDLTAMSETMMTAMIDNIYANASDYMGQTIKMGGKYMVNYNPGTGRHYHFVIYFDETACCSYGFEFTASNIEDFPSNETPVEVTGELKSYTEDGQTWYYLAASDFVISG